MELIKLLGFFRKILISSWETVDFLCSEDTSDFFKQNWLQANWEMILESFLCQKEGKLIILDHYGEGAEDLHYSLLEGQEGFDRVSLPSMAPTHTITCKPIKENLLCSFSNQIIHFPENGLIFGEFTSMSKNQVIEAPPFDQVLLIGEPFDFVAPFNELTFQLVPIDKSFKK